MTMISLKTITQTFIDDANTIFVDDDGDDVTSI